MKKMNKKLMAGVLSGVLLLGAGGALTTGYLTGKETVENVFSVGNIEIGLKEPEWEPEKGDGENMCPGHSVYKNPTIKNTASANDGGNPCYARMKVEIVNGDGSAVNNAEALKLIRQSIRYDSTFTGKFSAKGTGKVITEGRIPGYTLEEIQKLPMVNPLFKEDKERSGGNLTVYNYEGKDGTGILGIGEEATLFSAVVFPAQWTEKELRLIGDFKLIIRAEAIQTTGFASREDAYQALDGELTKEASYAG